MSKVQHKPEKGVTTLPGQEEVTFEPSHEHQIGISQTRSVQWHISEAVVSFCQATGKYMLKPMFHQVLWVIMGLSPKSYGKLRPPHKGLTRRNKG